MPTQQRKTPRKTTSRKPKTESAEPLENGGPKYAPTTWGGERFVDLTVPSGQLCQVRRPGVEGLVRVGLLKQTDALTSIVENKHIKRVKGQKEVDVKSLMGDAESLVKVMGVVDKIVAYVVVQPELRIPTMTTPDGEEVPINDADRQSNVIYTDMIDLEDRMFIFQYAVGGSKDIAAFRRQLGEFTGGVATVEAVAD